GSGPGAVTRDLIQLPEVAEAVGLDPSPVMVNRARERYSDVPGLSFEIGDARDTPFEGGSFDGVIFHTCLCHVPEPDKAMNEARRILKPGGRVVVFDGDYATSTAATRDGDPLQNAVDAAIANLVLDRWLVRSLTARIAKAGFAVHRQDAHPYLSKGDHAYFMTLVGRGIDFLMADGMIGADAADELKADAKHRIEDGSFFGFISFVSVIATK
ncbi:MAG: methyltransferase domain-containing protein, partial [Geminicoccaceae bacterium]